MFKTEVDVLPGLREKGRRSDRAENKLFSSSLYSKLFRSIRRNAHKLFSVFVDIIYKCRRVLRSLAYKKVVIRSKKKKKI